MKSPEDALIQSIYSTKVGAYQQMWKRLGDVYDGPGASISVAFLSLYALQKTGDYFRSIIYFINQVEAVHAQLEELDQLA